MSQDNLTIEAEVAAIFADLRRTVVRLLAEREAGSTRVCDQPGCTAAVIRRDDGSRVCARGHASRFVERSDLDVARARLAWLEQQAAKTVLIAGDPTHGFYVGAADGYATRPTLAEAIDNARGAL